MFPRLIVLFAFLTASVSLAEPAPLTFPRLNESDVQINIDGRLDETTWQEIPFYDGMRVTSPASGDDPRFETRVYYFYTDKGLYIGLHALQPVDLNLPRLTSRDSFSTRDAFSVTLDTSGEGKYGYWFMVALGDSVTDGIVLPERNFERDWDGPWRGASSELDDGWSAEMFLPWAMVNMPKSEADTRRMGIYVSRTLGSIHERWTFPYLPQTEAGFISRLQSIDLKGVNPTQEYSIYPYVASTQDGIGDRDRSRAGVDLFWRPSTYLRLSATLNPDFGQVEADDVVVNFTAFETFFPEKRLFFLENREVFVTSPRKASSGTLLNTRRIGASIASRRGSSDSIDGVELNTVDRNGPVDLVGALKVTGEQGRLRYGVMTAIEDDMDVRTQASDLNSIIEGRNFSVLRLIHENTDDGGRRAFGYMGTRTDHSARDATAHGLDAHLRTPDSKLQWDGQLFMSDIDGVRGYGGLSDIRWQPKTGHEHKIELEYFDDQLDLNDLGFLPRNDRLGVLYDYELRESPYKGLLERRTDINVRGNWTSDQLLTDARVYLRRRWSRLNNIQYQAAVTYRPEYWDDRNSRGNGTYRRQNRWQVEAGVNSDWAKPYVADLMVNLREESEGGTRQSISTTLFIRPSDRWSFSIRANYTDGDSWLIHRGDRNFSTYSFSQWSPRIRYDIFFSSKQQLGFVLQWVGIKAFEDRRWLVPTQRGDLIDNGSRPDTGAADFAVSDMTVQVRYRWEIAPLSDLFVVYNRGGRATGVNTDDQYDSLLSDAFSNPTSEFLVMKLRYRVGPG